MIYPLRNPRQEGFEKGPAHLAVGRTVAAMMLQNQKLSCVRIATASTSLLDVAFVPVFVTSPSPVQ